MPSTRTAILGFLLFVAVIGRAVADPPAAPGGAADAATQPASPNARESNQHVDTTVISDLVSQLSSSVYAEREAAEESLKEIGPPAIELLQKRYLETDDFEVRLRIQRVVAFIYLWKEVLSRNGFLGVRPEPRTRAQGLHYRLIEPGKAAYEVTHVVPGSAADLGGMLKDDLIISADGIRFPDTPLYMADRGTLLSHYIRDKLPGTVLTFELYRGTRLLTLRIPISYRPPEQYGPNRASADLVAKYDEAVAAFPEWWAANFGNSPVEDAEQLFPFVPPTD